MSETSDPALAKIEGIRVEFGGVVAVDTVDLQVRGGEICGLIGPNGAGKSTLFDVIAGVRTPTKGCVQYDGDDVTNKNSIALARRGIRRTFQQVQVFGWLSVADNVLAATEWRRGGGGVLADLVAAPTRSALRRNRLERVEEVIRSCGLWDHRDRPAATLPTGHARMLELARAIVDPPRLLMLDEPASGLDSAEAERLAEEVHRVRSVHGTAVLLVEHSVPFVMKHCDRIVVLDLGSVIAEGSPDEILNDPLVQTAYLGHSK